VLEPPYPYSLSLERFFLAFWMGSLLAILQYNLKGISDAVGMSGVPASNCVHKLTPETLLPIHRHAATQEHQGAILGAISRACTFFSSILLHPRTRMAAAVIAGAATWVAFLLALDLSSLIANKMRLRNG
jgi:hypothetical protein